MILFGGGGCIERAGQGWEGDLLSRMLLKSQEEAYPATLDCPTRGQKGLGLGSVWDALPLAYRPASRSWNLAHCPSTLL